MFGDQKWRSLGLGVLEQDKSWHLKLYIYINPKPLNPKP